MASEQHARDSIWAKDHGNTAQNPVRSNIFSGHRPISLMTVTDFEEQFTVPPPPYGTGSLKSNGEWTTKFQLACDKRSLKPTFEYHSAPGQTWDAEVFFGADFFDRAGSYSSKKIAKEQLCKQALDKLPPLQPNAPHVSDLGLPPVPPNLMAQNWVGILNEYAQGQRIALPVFHETAAHISLGPFSCTVTFAGCPAAPLGAAAGPFRTKSEAKKNAAMEAVLWLRAERRRLRATIRPPTSTIPTATATVESPAQDPGASPATGAAAPASASAAADEPSSLPARVADLAKALGIVPPSYLITAQDPPFVTMEAVFSPQDVAYHPTLSGAIGRVEEVIGKKEAKSRCCKGVLDVLEEIEQSRMAEAAEYFKQNLARKRPQGGNDGEEDFMTDGA